MNKKIITAALAATAAVLTAGASVYEVQMNLTTTVAQEDSFKEAMNYCKEVGNVAYRKMTKLKIKAVLWGEGCGDGSGIAIWNENQKFQYAPDSSLVWEILNRVGRNGQEAEGLWTSDLYYDTGDHAAHLYGAATGKVKGDDQLTLTGNIAGYAHAGQVIKVKKDKNCMFCGKVEVSVLNAIGWGICDCSADDDDRTAVHGTWTMKYIPSATKTYNAGGDIAAAYKFPSYVTP